MLYSLRGAIAKMGGAIVLGQLVAVAVAPLLSRLYSPADFGQFALYSGVVGVLAMLVTMSVREILPASHDTVERDHLTAFSMATTIVGVVGILVAALGLMILEVDSDLTHGQFWLWLAVPAGVLVLAIYDLDAALMIREMRYQRLAQRTLTQYLSQALTQLAFAFLPLAGGGLSLGFIAGRGAALLLPTGIRRGGVRARGDWRRGWRAYRERGVLLLPAQLLNVATPLMSATLVTVTFGITVTGQYALAERIIAVPIMLLSAAVGQVFYGAFAKVVREDPGAAPATFWKVLRQLLLIGALPILLLSLTAPWWFPTIFGPEWQQAGVLVALMAPGFAMQAAVAPLSSALVALDRVDLRFYWDLSRFGLVALTLTIGNLSGAAVTTVFAFLGVAWVLSYLVMLVMVRASLMPRGSDASMPGYE